MMKYKIFLLLFCLKSNFLFAQLDTCDCKKNKPFVIPSILLGVGTINFLDKSLDKGIQKWRTEKYSAFNTKIDDYIFYAPMITGFALNLSGVKGKHKEKSLLYSSASALLTTSVVYALKSTVQRDRPDVSSSKSFPSGHTASAFSFATVFHKEYGHRSRWYSIGAYSIATATGALRVMNNKHWLSDVCVGAGIGILSTELVYRGLDKWSKKRRLQHKKSFF